MMMTQPSALVPGEGAFPRRQLLEARQSSAQMAIPRDCQRRAVDLEARRSSQLIERCECVVLKERERYRDDKKCPPGNYRGETS